MEEAETLAISSSPNLSSHCLCVLDWSTVFPLLLSRLVQGDGSAWGSTAPLQAGARGPTARPAGRAGGGRRLPGASWGHPSPLCGPPRAPEHSGLSSGGLEYGHRGCQPRLQAASTRSCLYGPPELRALPPGPRGSCGLLEEGGLVGAQDPEKLHRRRFLCIFQCVHFSQLLILTPTFLTL